MKIQDINILSPEQVKSEMDKARSLKRTYFEFGHRMADGFVRDVEVYSGKVEVNGKELLHSIIHDITERKQAEAQRVKSHELLSNLARLVPGVIYQYRLYPDGRSASPYASPGMNDIYEVTPEEVRDDATPVYGRLHPEDYDHVVDTIQESARTLQTFYCEFRVILPRQGLRWRWSQAHPERMPDGSVLWHGIISDISEHKQAEAGGKLSVSLKQIELSEYNRVTPEMSPGLYACLTVADTGTGMTPEVMNRIFDPFFTTKEKGKGTGMGLSVVHEIVENMNGVIQVHSESGIGTEFHIYLPVVKGTSKKKSL